MIRADHIGLRARTRSDAARLLAKLLNLDGEIPDNGRFAELRVSPEFTIVFYDSEQIQPTHVAFVVDDPAFDATLERLERERIAYGSQPNDPTNGRIDHPLCERGLFFQTPDGHLFEVMASPNEAGSR
jgi:catechol 2,3-dioxygenase-like lactoylglutathione lyase family enzyme